MKDSLLWFITIFGTYAFLCTVGCLVTYILYDICSDLYDMWRSRK